MSTKPAALGIIDPDLVYTLERVAITLGTTPRFVREQWINTDEIDAMPFGRTYLIPGHVVINLVQRKLQGKGEP